MGAWGTAIFSNDAACDVRDDYRDLIADGVDDEDASARVQRKHLCESADLRPYLEPTFWLALALSKWKLGRLDDVTRANAIAVIDSGRDIANWHRLDASPATVRARSKVLAALRVTLLSPQPARRELRRPKKRVSPFAVGDVVRYTLGSGRLVLFRVTSIHTDREGERPVAEVLAWAGAEVPSRGTLESLPARHRVKAAGWESVRFPRILLPPLPKRGFDLSRVAVVARGLPMPRVSSEGFSVMAAWPFDEYLAERFGLQ